MFARWGFDLQRRTGGCINREQIWQQRRECNVFWSVGTKSEAWPAAFASFELLLRRDEICLHQSCSFPFPVGRKNHLSHSVSLFFFHVKVANPSLQRTLYNHFLIHCVSYYAAVKSKSCVSHHGALQSPGEDKGSASVCVCGHFQTTAEASEWFGMHN